jgi:hypothetical protein
LEAEQALFQLLTAVLTMSLCILHFETRTSSFNKKLINADAQLSPFASEEYSPSYTILGNLKKGHLESGCATNYPDFKDQQTISGYLSLTKTGGIKNRPSAKKRGTPKSLPLENHTKSQCNP